jgi:prepilin-type N-terminal cleavage/methylation domain-containing protein
MGARGFTMAELIVVVALIGIIMAIGMPVFLTFWQTSTLKAGAEELAAIVNNGRLLAIKENQNVCVQSASNTVRYLVGSCSGTVWTGPGTDGSGRITLANNVQVSSNTDIVFNYLGAATTAGTYTVRNPTDGRTLSVVVATTGRVTLGP